MYEKDVKEKGLKVLGDTKTGEYFPIRVSQKSMFYQGFEARKPNVVPALEFPLFLNKLEINDYWVKFGSIGQRLKEFIGWGPMRRL